ncbi:MAG: hypothetical protein QRY72_01665 [Candidatus Rhabdochlamydia sp.]
MRKFFLPCCLCGFIGICLLLFSHYLDVRIERGKAQLVAAEEKMEATSSFFHSSHSTKLIKAQITQQIQEGKSTLIHYEQLLSVVRVISYLTLLSSLLLIILAPLFKFGSFHR